MRISSGLILAACLLAAAPALAGNLTFDNGQTTWHSTQCAKPGAPGSIVGANAETAGDDMNSLSSQHNAYVDAMQNYMNCLSDEAERDQTAVNQAIADSAQKAIAEAQGEVDSDALVVHSRDK